MSASEQGSADYLLPTSRNGCAPRGWTSGCVTGSAATRFPWSWARTALSVAVVTDDALPAAGTSLRDQVRWQRARLESLGWVVVPLWTLDAFIDPAAATAEILRALGRSEPVVRAGTGA